MNKLLLFLAFLLLHTPVIFSQDLVQSGPMVGYSTMREALLWVQTTETAAVHFEYFDKENPKERFSTEKYTTQARYGFVAKLVADQILPGKKYSYELYINGKKIRKGYPMEFQSQTLWQWRTDPPEVNFAVGSCNYVNEERFDRPGKPYGSEFEIFESIHDKRPDFMLWLGDNTYLREADWNSRTGFLHRYTHTRSLPEMQPLLASTHHYAIWDDHDYGPNDSDGSFWLKETAAEIFKLFWGNPNYDVTGNGGITGSFQWADLQFFLLDNRYHRTSNRNFTEEREMLGKAQIDWLINALASSRAPFKFVAIGGQVLSTEAMYENHATFSNERRYLLDKIREAKIEGVIFLDGDRHHTGLSVMQESRYVYPLYDLTCSSLTAGAYDDKEKLNTNKLEETLVGQHNFGILNVSGPRTDRVLNIKIFDKDGKELWTKDIKAKDLKYKRR
ncbi:alkaline phosphatase D family protein [Aureisphaera galaxeae]|uniref:alkaline phosphatase D family protein n=1 Tax=Aureisphaera galaxeae TaxID=1538023 RepID=UPI0023502B71|nr:alkaline phosphatase D family protein [Aureisphaera galaxeae]MDC8005861.1 alkaline phosphatase D family protein [Aureisphaera galaxeae]